VPLLMAATGASLELRKLQVYPIPVRQLFAIEALLRVTAGIEMVMVLTGIAAGILLNPAMPKWVALAAPGFVLFNLFLAVGLRDLLLRMMARKRFREIIVFLLVMCTALPQLLMTRGPARFHVLALLTRDSWAGWPWIAASNLAQGQTILASSAILAAWTLAAAAFGYFQFDRTLAFDKEAAGASGTRGGARQRMSERLLSLPSAMLRDPVGAMVEKEIRSLMRSPRFRLVFLMGFTFGLVILLPVSFGRGAWFGNDYLTAVSVYSLLLLSDACFWNSFGFDRSAAQIYFLAPVPFSRVLIAKNLSATFFIALEMTAVTLVCGLIRMPLDLRRISEAYSVAAVITIFLLAAGNLLSIHHARGVNPGTQIRSNAAGRLQAMLLVIYPVAFIPVAIAYLARHVFESEWSFFGVLLFDAVAGFITYRISLDSAARAADRMKEQMIANLSVGANPIAG